MDYCPTVSFHRDPRRSCLWNIPAAAAPVSPLWPGPALPTILVMVGAHNLMRGALDVYRSMVELPRPAQLLFVCGKDERLRRVIERLAQRALRPVRVFGYVREIPD